MVNDSSKSLTTAQRAEAMEAVVSANGTAPVPGIIRQDWDKLTANALPACVRVAKDGLTGISSTGICPLTSCPRSRPMRAR